MVDPLLYGDAALEKIFSAFDPCLGAPFRSCHLPYSEAKSLSYVDDLTDLYNQRYLKLGFGKRKSAVGKV